MDDPDDITCMTFVLKEEDHTLGNALRYMIMKKWGSYTVLQLVQTWMCCTWMCHVFSYCPSRIMFSSKRFICSPEVTFCGYSVPHPSEHKINLRIQTNG